MLGRHKQAIEIFNDCLEIDKSDWEIFYYKGLSYRYLKLFQDAISCFEQANQLHSSENTYLELGRVYQLMQNY